MKIVLSLVLILSISCAHSSERPKPVASTPAATAAPEEDYVTRMDKAAAEFKKTKDVKKLASILKEYKTILKDDKEDYAVESFASIYMDAELKPKLMSALVESTLSLPEREDFLARLQRVVIEMTHGNG